MRVLLVPSLGDNDDDVISVKENDIDVTITEEKPKKVTQLVLKELFLPDMETIIIFPYLGKPHKPPLFQVERKRHLGNDIVLIVFRDAECAQPFDPLIIKSQFHHVFAVSQKG